MMSVSDKWSVRWELENERISQTRGHKSFLSSGLITIMDTPTEGDSQGREKILYMGITFILFSGVKQHHKLKTVKRVCKQYRKIFREQQFFCFICLTLALLSIHFIYYMVTLLKLEIQVLLLNFPVAYSHNIRNSDHNQILNHRRNEVIQCLVIMLRQFKHFFVERILCSILDFDMHGL